MNLLAQSIAMDWPVLLPIFVCSILVVAVVINRFSFYKKNKRDVVLFIPRLQKELVKNNLAPFLGLFGTVVRILFTFQDLASQGNQSAAVASGIASALIATAFGLGVAIVAVIFYNSFQSIVKRYEDDFQLIKLLFLSFVDSNDESTTPSNANISL